MLTIEQRNTRNKWIVGIILLVLFLVWAAKNSSQQERSEDLRRAVQQDQADVDRQVIESHPEWTVQDVQQYYRNH